MKIGVKIMPRKEVLDTQGRAVENILQQHGNEGVNCQVGRYVVLTMKEENVEKAMQQARGMTELVLYNPLIETFELEKL